MANKAVPVLVLLLAAFLLIASEVAARDLAQNTQQVKKTEAETDQYRGGYQRGEYGADLAAAAGYCPCYFCCGNHCCTAAEKAKFDAAQAKPQN